MVWFVTFVGCGALEPAARHHEPAHVARDAETSGGETAVVADAPTVEGRAGATPTRAAEGAEDTRPALETYRGRASYYADSLAGHSTASGEPYDPTLYTAASRELPFGTVVRVVREDTGVSVIVRVNDRGPFGDRGRILDLSRAAADELEMLRAGVVRIRAEVVEWGPGRR
jgi:rare lipoprotein A